MGSPVYFPNYKVPFLIEAAGLHISAHMDCTTLELWRSPLAKGAGEPLTAKLAGRFYKNDCSGAYAKNDTLLLKVSQFMKKNSIDGVVYQVLKGQIEADFELERFEKLFEAYGLPVFRLETDYSGQDVEQLRIRLDAFMELLTQRRYRKGAKAI
jgi:benzoyl-CoA reductase/2-hydroxyglutaryl-CoA dehydratase subunit BcrC/BadD/HgdB